MKYIEMLHLNQALIELSDKRMSGGSARLYLNLHNNIQSLEVGIDVFTKAREQILKDAENEKDAQRKINELLQEPCDINLQTITYTDLEVFEGLTINILNALTPILIQEAEAVNVDSL